MKKITQFSVDYPVTVSMIVLGILLLGFISLQKLNIDLFPELHSPKIFIELKTGELPPEEIEKRFIENMESIAIRQKGVSSVSSIIKTGSARIAVEYTWGSDMNEAFLDLQKAMSMAGSNEEIESLNITQHDPNASPVMILAMRHSEITDLNELRKIGEGYIRNELIRLEGIADVVLSGVEEKQMIISTDPYKLKAFGLTVDEIVLRIQGLNQTISGGTIVEQGFRHMIKGTGKAKDKHDLENIVVGYKQATIIQPTATAATVSGRAPVYLKDVASVSFESKEPNNIVRINGERCMGLSVYRETGFNTVKAVENLEEALITMEKALPGYRFTIVQNQGTFIKSAINEVKESAVFGSVIAIIVLFFFLRRIGITLIISIAIPISIVATFNLMYFNHLTLNIMTLGGLALGAGMLVDNAIVVVENIFRNLEKGMSIKEAAVKGTSQVGGAIVASTITTIVVFLPIVYLSGPSSALFKDQAWTVSFSLLASLFVAILVIPMLFHRVYKNSKTPQYKSVRILWYGRLLGKILDHRKLVIFLALIAVGVTAYIYPKVGSEYLPKSGSGEFNIELTLSEGSYLQRTEGAVTTIEEMLKSLLGDKIENIYSQAGSNLSANDESAIFQGDNTALVKVRLGQEAAKDFESIIASVQGMLSGIPEMEVKVVKEESSLMSSIGVDEAPVTVEIRGDDLEQLEQISAAIKTRLSTIPELVNIESNIEKGAPEVDIVIDRYKASLYGLNAGSIVTQLKDHLTGKEAGHIETGSETNDIMVKLPAVSLSELNGIYLKGNTIDIPLYEVAQITNAQAPKKLFRRDQNRIAKVTANLQGDLAFDQAAQKVKSNLSGLEIPPGYRIEIVGEEAKRQETMSSMGFALILSVALVYMVLASQFESLVHPFTILLTIPLAVIGAVWAFYLLGIPLNMMAYIGIIMLGGIAVNNSIILVDAINQLKALGKDLRTAIIEAGENRVRPILMTSLTTILALLPLSLGFGESASLRSPLAISVIGGLITSTLLTLAAIPCVYYIFDRNKGSRVSKKQTLG